MQIQQIANATRVMAKDQPEYQSLPIFDEVIDGVPYMTSVWLPSPEELEQLVAGGSVTLRIIGRQHPPVIIETQPKPKDGQ